MLWVPLINIVRLSRYHVYTQSAAVDCGSLNSPENGDVDLPGTSFDSIAQYSCNLGYLLVGVESRQCQANRTWSDESPICEGLFILLFVVLINLYSDMKLHLLFIAVDCGSLNDPDNGMVSVDGTRLNSEAVYGCDTGYRLVGDSERLCTEQGAWSGDQPTCESKASV